MKHLKRYNEDLSFLKELNRLLSDDDFNKYAEEFDSIIEGFLEYADEGYELKFETAYGRQVHMKYEDYLKKNEKYQEFIHGLPKGGLFFSSQIMIPYDYKLMLSLLEDIQSSVDRIGDLGWVMKKFDISGFTNHIAFGSESWSQPRIVVTHEFQKGKKG